MVIITDYMMGLLFINFVCCSHGPGGLWFFLFISISCQCFHIMVQTKHNFGKYSLILCITTDWKILKVIKSKTGNVILHGLIRKVGT